MKSLVDSLMKQSLTLIIAGTIVIYSHSCNPGPNQLAYLQNTDSLTIHFFKPRDTLILTPENRVEISLLTETMMDGAGASEELQDTTGKMLFTQKGSLLLEVYFSTPSTGSKFGAPVFTFVQNGKTGGGRFTYKAGSFLEDAYNEMRKSSKHQ